MLTKMGKPNMRLQPVCFQVGFPDTGGDYIAELFRANNYKAFSHENGTLAEEIVAARIEKRTPFSGMQHATLFSNLFKYSKFPNPTLEGFKDFPNLDSAYPNAVFILTEREIEKWIFDRYEKEQGQFRRREALRLGVAETSISRVWAAEWKAHTNRLVDYFSFSDRFLRFRVDQDNPVLLAHKLLQWFDIQSVPEVPRRYRSSEKNRNFPQRRTIFSPFVETLPASDPSDGDKSFSDHLARFCIGDVQSHRKDFAISNFSSVYANWDGKDKILGKNGQPLPLAISEFRGRPVVYKTGKSSKLERIQGVLNEILWCEQRLPLSLDMEDARRFGTSGIPCPPESLLVYNRKSGAQNMVLWPLIGYHSPNAPGLEVVGPEDDIPFDEKSDQCVWRGDLSGRPSRPYWRDESRFRGAKVIYDDIAKCEQGSSEWSALVEELSSIPRVQMVAKLKSNSDFDIGLTPSKMHERAFSIPEIARHIVKRKDRSWFRRYKYVLSVSGFDTGSNFLMAASSNSVVLKEEDGWEVFYSGVFLPWEHYIPLVSGAMDVEEKLEWAREHPTECKRMVKSAQEVCRKLANLNTRRRFLQLTLEGYSASY